MEPTELYGLSAFRRQLSVISDQEDGRVSSSLQLRIPVTNLWPPDGGSLQLEADGFSVARQPLLGHLEVGQGNQDQDCDINKVFPSGVIGACVLKVSSISPERK